VSARDLDTPHGPARVLVQPAPDPVATLVLGHGAGGSVSAPDLVTATRAALEQRVSVALVEQPYRVAGRKSPPPAPKLDEAWIAAVEQLDLGGLPLIAGGRSSGARVACRTAEATGAAGVLCLAFPLIPPQRKSSAAPAKTRQDELDAVSVPMLIVQGQNDRFGMPRPAGNREVAVVAGDHGLKSDLAAVGAAVRDWLARLTT
jgi:uncharacterized protein